MPIRKGRTVLFPSMHNFSLLAPSWRALSPCGRRDGARIFPARLRPAERENRDLSADESTKFDAAKSKVSDLDNPVGSSPTLHGVVIFGDWTSLMIGSWT